MSDTNHLPTPRVSPDSAPFWAACKGGQLELPVCATCKKAHLPPGPVCPFCFSDTIEWKPASGRGEIASWVEYHMAFSNRFSDQVPYLVVLVELDEGPRLVSSIRDTASKDMRVGMRVEVGFEELKPGLIVPTFSPIEDNANGDLI